MADPIKVTPVSGYRTSDGLFFCTEAEAVSHEYAMKFRALVADFVASPHWPYNTVSGITPSMAAKIIPAWESFKHSNAGKAKP